MIWPENGSQPKDFDLLRKMVETAYQDGNIAPYKNVPSG
jgi:hypothetical protein